jgi:hypothetical protein
MNASCSFRGSEFDIGVEGLVFWLPASILPTCLPIPYGRWLQVFVAGYSGATASDFHGLPWAFPQTNQPKNLIDIRSQQVLGQERSRAFSAEWNVIEIQQNAML